MRRHSATIDFGRIPRVDPGFWENAEATQIAMYADRSIRMLIKAYPLARKPSSIAPSVNCAREAAGVSLQAWDDPPSPCGSSRDRTAVACIQFASAPMTPNASSEFHGHRHAVGPRWQRVIQIELRALAVEIHIRIFN